MTPAWGYVRPSDLLSSARRREKPQSPPHYRPQPSHLVGETRGEWPENGTDFDREAEGDLTLYLGEEGKGE